MVPQERALGPVFIYLSRPAAAAATTPRWHVRRSLYNMHDMPPKGVMLVGEGGIRSEREEERGEKGLTLGH